MLRHRPRLLVALAAAILTGLTADLAGAALSHAVLIGWCLGAACWLALILAAMLPAPASAMRERTAALDEGTWPMLLGTLGATLASLAAVVWALAEAPSPAPPSIVALGLGTVLLSWLFVHVLFAVHYAHEDAREGSGIDFPGEERPKPDFGEYLYFAFTIGMTFQVSDATTASTRMRRLVLVHALVSFLFNAIIIGAAVNLAAALAR